MDAAMSELSRILQDEWEFTFNPVDCHICCLPHIYNLCVQRVLDNYTCADFTECPPTWKDATGKVINKAEYVEAVHGNPIGHGRTVMHNIRLSSQCHSNFQATIISGNKHEWFDINKQVVQLPVVQLLHNVKTHWDSTYYMINRFQVLQQVSHLILLQDVDLWILLTINVMIHRLSTTS